MYNPIDAMLAAPEVCAYDDPAMVLECWNQL